MTAQPQEPLTVVSFVAWESCQDGRHEFLDGRIYGFAGGTLGHSALAAAIIARVRARALPCKTLTSDALVQMQRSARYADVVVTCDERDGNDAIAVRYPKLIVEVLSDSTSAVDRGEKLDEYRAIETLQEYILIDSRKPWAESYRRVDGQWIASLPLTTGELRLASLGLAIDIDELYRECGIADQATP